MAGYAFRPFGVHKGDLDIDFDSPRPRLVSDVLVACLLPTGNLVFDRAALDALPVGDRLAMLVKLLRASGQDTLVAALTCNAIDCGGSFEIEIDLSTLLDYHRHANQESEIEAEADGGSIHLRRPTAEDQNVWRQGGFLNPHLATEKMVQSLVIESEVGMDSPIPEIIIQAIEKAMRAADPLMAPTIESECPDCGQRQQQVLDLGSLLLRRLERIQTGMIEDIHVLASSYHWTEDQVLALPAKRREQYLKLIDREG